MGSSTDKSPFRIGDQLDVKVRKYDQDNKLHLVVVGEGTVLCFPFPETQDFAVVDMEWSMHEMPIHNTGGMNLKEGPFCPCQMTVDRDGVILMY